ncbi:thymidine phosphorylase, partial [Candidatus Micrarchaeota archaeon]|nr:thymidine phosphorylase [Candidatus Micrarchaeota archaeon]
MKLQFRAKLLPVEQGQNEVVLNGEEAHELNIELMDRVKLSVDGREAVAMVDHSILFVKRGEIGLFDEIAKALKAKNNDIIPLEVTTRPPSLDFIKKKLDGGVLTGEEIKQIIDDIMGQRLSDAEISA